MMAAEIADAMIAALQPGKYETLRCNSANGNADELFELDKKIRQPALNKDGSFKAKMAHTLNPVPLFPYDNISGGKPGLKQTETAGLSNIADTVANLLGLEKRTAWDESLLDIS